MSEAAAPAEDIAHDNLCPVCHLLLFAPVKTTCAHVLCSSCMAQWADASSTTNISHSSLDLDLSQFDPSYDPTYDLEANCPMCRTRTTASPDNSLARQLEQRYPHTYEERRKEEEVERGQCVGEGGVEGVMILIGNRHHLVRGEESANKHDWTFFVRTSRPEIVKEVRINLHPTFRPPRLILRQPPFEVRRLGWGYFTVEAKIVLREPYGWVMDGSSARQEGLKLDWTLDFEGRGRQGRVRAKVKRVEEVTIEEEPVELEERASPVRWPHMDPHMDTEA